MVADGFLLQPIPECTLYIVLEKVGGVGFAPIGDRLQGGDLVLAAPEIGKVGGDDHETANVPSRDIVQELPSVADNFDIEVARVGERFGEALRVGGRVLHDQADPEMVQVEGNAVSI